MYIWTFVDLSMLYNYFCSKPNLKITFYKKAKQTNKKLCFHSVLYRGEIK